MTFLFESQISSDNLTYSIAFLKLKFHVIILIMTHKGPIISLHYLRRMLQIPMIRKKSKDKNHLCNKISDPENKSERSIPYSLVCYRRKCRLLMWQKGSLTEEENQPKVKQKAENRDDSLQRRTLLSSLDSGESIGRDE